ncbi:PilN domain-containing protein [Buttiauxella noackiae]|uniref:PilN domain-containing protein n=1 Tax=Buttiauxella noackiae TaxID=82992 RepID=UPI0035A740B8
MRLINLLPWRQIQRQQRMRHWSFLFCLVLVLVPLLVMTVRQFSAWEIRQQQARNDYLTSMQSALEHLYQRRLVQQKQNKEMLRLQQTREAQQKAIQIWEKRLIRIASFMPGGAWLSSLTLQKGQFIVKGHSGLLEDLQVLEKELTHLEGVSAVRTGAVQYEAQGGFGFVFTLTISEVANALVN